MKKKTPKTKVRRRL
jgi:hypothetical protein